MLLPICDVDGELIDTYSVEIYDDGTFEIEYGLSKKDLYVALVSHFWGKLTKMENNPADRAEAYVNEHFHLVDEAMDESDVCLSLAEFSIHEIAENRYEVLDDEGDPMTRDEIEQMLADFGAI